jgi:hypothetical protein
MKIKPLETGLIVLFVALAALVGYLVTLDASHNGDERDAEISESEQNPLLTKISPAESQSGNTPTKSKAKSGLDALFAIPKERIVTFETDEDYRSFLESVKGSRLRLLGTLAPLRAVRLGYDNYADFEGLLDEEQLSFNYVVSPPLPPGEGDVQSGAVGFNGNALQWLGINDDNTAWGDGVTVAIIDTGIAAHPALAGRIRHFDLTDDQSPELNGHGTAVASLIAGQDRTAPGVAPSSNLLDIRVADAEGNSSSFQLAEGILTAVAEGAEVINISMGSFGDSPLVRRAVEQATAKGIVIVASSGNEGYTSPTFPAGYPDVVAVGGVGADGSLLGFSNIGDQIDITAPGLAINAAWPGEKYISFSGTSASAPLAAGSVAGGMSELNLSATNSRDLMLELANESGPPGADVYYGNGHLDTGRMQRSNQEGVYDLAAVSNFVTEGPNPSLLVVVQNQGTTIINNANATVRTSGSEYPLTIPRLAPNEIQTFELPFRLDGGEEIKVQTTTNLNASHEDAEPTNDRKESSLGPIPQAP